MKTGSSRVFILLLVISILTSIALPHRSFADSDATPPALEKVELSNSEITAGESNIIYITTTDDLSGVDYIWYQVKSPSGNQTYSTISRTRDTQGRWYGSIPTNIYAESGTWKITAIALQDKAGNSKFYYYGQDYTANFIVNNENGDATAPVLEKVELGKTEIKAGESNTIYITTKDDLSGVDYIWYQVKSPSGSQTYSTISRTRDTQGRWYGSIPTNINAESGTWKITAIALQDKAGNSKFYYYGQDYIANFIVNNENGDATAPVLEKVELGKTEIKAGESNTIYITTTDDLSGVDYIWYQIKSPSGNQTYSTISRTRDTQGRWYGSIPTNINAESGTWEISAIALQDKAGNSKFYYYGQDYTLGFTVKNEPSKVNSVTLSTDLPSPQKAGSNIQLKATSDGSDTPEYRFMIRDEKGNLTTLQEYGSSDTAVWTPAKEGTYTIIVHAKDKSKSGSNYYYEARSEMIYKVEPAKVTSVGLTVDKPSPQLAGTSISIKASSQGSPNPEYRFFVKDEKGNLITLQEYGSSDTATWTPTEPGTYTIIAHAKDKSKSGANNYYEARSEMVYKINAGKVSSVSVLASKLSPQVEGTTISLKAGSQGSANPEYRFYIRDEQGNLTTLQDFSSNDTATWVPTKPGTYTIIVHAKDKYKTGSSSYYEARTEIVYKVNSAKVTQVSMLVSKLSPQLAGTAISIKAESQGSPNPEYRFYIRDEQGNLTTLQEYSSNDSVAWTPTKPGTYTIIVHSKNKYNSGSNYYFEARTEMIYRVD
ncbi:triple tyrosine motif-containing protein [Bacillus sp. OTU2372]|uniref:triple tyrosine motif-containing protein n=1 Tax=Bacillus sp. OTU2372 TaxID=3043858 RepID=UPI00313E14C6